MLDSVKWKENFRIKEQNGITNAYATIINKVHWIGLLPSGQVSACWRMRWDTIKAGQAFVFEFEIYNYGWLRLKYFNGFQDF